MPKTSNNPAEYITPLELDGLKGRMISLPAKDPLNYKEILFIYGHHSSLERWWGLIQVLSRYGTVTAPDLPGFGGMESFYKIGKKPTIDNLADYLATFLRRHYPDKQVTIAGMSFGFVIVTRMLQRHPDLCQKVTLLVSIVGFAHKDDFTFGRARYYTYLYGTRLFCHRPFSTVFRYVALNPLLLRPVYSRTHNARHKFKQVSSQEEFNQLMKIEIGLWHDNEIRTYMFTTAEFLELDNCGERVNLPIWHVAAKADHFFDNNLVEQHMRQIFSDFHVATTTLTTHAPSVMADEDTAASLIPANLHLALTKI